MYWDMVQPPAPSPLHRRTMGVREAVELRGSALIGEKAHEESAAKGCNITDKGVVPKLILHFEEGNHVGNM